MLVAPVASAQQVNPMEVTYAENDTVAVGTYRAVDPEGEDIMWDVGGTDASSFEISADGVLTFKKSPDFEMQSSYSVDVMANEAKLLTVTVTITNEQEPGTVELTQPQPQVGRSVGTVLEDDDGVPTAGVMWEWAKSADKVTWEDIDGAESPDYTPQPGDVGMYLRATATYDDAAAPDDDSATRDVNEGLVSTSDDTGISENTVRGDPSANAAPVFPDEEDPAGTADPMAISIPENSTGAIDDPVTATDADNDIRLYTLDETPEVDTTVVARDDGAARFEIDARSGQISVTDGTVLNFDDDTEITGGNNAESYVVTVTATDPSGASDTVEVTITVADVDEPPVFDDAVDANPTEVETAEDQDTPLGQEYTAPDPDTTVDTGVNWTVSDDTNFTIVGGTLAFADGVTPDYEKQPEYVITITATGNRTSPAASTVSASIEVTVKITDVAEEGTVTLSARQPQVGKAVTAKLDEMDGNPTSIQWRWGTVTAVAECEDALFESGDFADVEPSASYMPKAGAGDVGDTGDYLCAQASYFDDAEPADADPDNDPASPAPRDTTVGASEAVVEVKPSSNAKPAFTDGDDEGSDADPVEIEIEENETGTVGDPVTASDSDGPPPDDEVQDLLLYSLGGPDAASFTIADRGASAAGQISVADGVELDFESPSDVGGTAGDNEYVVMVKAADPSGAYDMVEVTIKVTDMDEDPEAPEGITNPSEVDYAENTPITVAVGTYRAVDPEGEDIMWDVGGTDAASFSIDAGVLTFKKSPDFEMQSSYSVDVMANEAKLLTVTVTITNEQEPGTVELTQPQPQVDQSVGTVLEDDDGVPTAGVMWEWAKSADKVTWEDIDGAESPDYTPQPGDVGMYLRATATYDDAAAPDDDSATRDVNEGLVSTSDDTGISENTVRGDPSANAAAVFPDEEDPAGTADPMAISIPENSTGAIGDPVTATDADNDIRLYTLDETPEVDTTVVARDDGAARFEIDARSGQISVTDGTVLNFDDDTEITGGNNAESYVVTVTATDPSGAADTVTVTITVTDVDEPPVFDDAVDANPTEVETAEDQDTPLSQAYTADDPDTTDDGVNWTVSDDTNFTIGTGTLAFADGVTPDYEKQSEYVITITATGNRTSPAASTVSASIEVTVKITDVAEEGTVTLSARQPQVGKAVTAKLDEMDGNPTSIQWRWTTDTTEGCSGADFADIEPSASYMPKAGAGDVGDTGDYLCAQASYFDDAEPAVADPPDADPTSPAPRDITVGASEAVVEVKPVSNAKPAFTDGDDEGSDADPIEIEIEENAPGAVGDPVTATDGDTAPVQDLLLYSLSGPDAASFTIADRGASAGQISVADGVELDFESPSDVGGTAGDNEYVVMVTAEDPSGASDTVMVTITVTGVDEDPELLYNVAPEFDTESTELMVAENTPVGTAVGTVTATDADEGDTLTYSDDSMYFDVDAMSGEITTAMMLDYEAMASHMVTVMATDVAGASDSIDVTVTVGNVVECEDAGATAVADRTNSDLLADCDALLNIMDDLVGDGTALNWSVDTPMADWQGVASGTGRVAGIYLRDKGLAGVIPAGITALDALVRLNLGDNDLTGEIPDLSDLDNVDYLTLGGNAFTGGIPATLGGMASLERLWLHRNDGGFDGGIPSELSQATSLIRLYLYDNGLTGEIPSELGSLPILRYLMLHNNELTGQIPSELGNASDMKALYLYNNMLTGSIPASLGDMVDAEGESVRLMYLHNNMLTGDVPSELGNLVSLRILRLGGNMLTGCIPAAIAGAAADADAAGLMACADDGS